MECDEVLLGKVHVVLVISLSDEEESLHLHQYKSVSKLPPTLTVPSGNIHDFPLLTQLNMLRCLRLMKF